MTLPVQDFSSRGGPTPEVGIARHTAGKGRRMVMVGRIDIRELDRKSGASQQRTGLVAESSERCWPGERDRGGCVKNKDGDVRADLADRSGTSIVEYTRV